MLYSMLHNLQEAQSMIYGICIYKLQPYEAISRGYSQVITVVVSLCWGELFKWTYVKIAHGVTPAEYRSQRLLEVVQ